MTERRLAELEADVQHLRDTVAALWRRIESGARMPATFAPVPPPPPAPLTEVVSTTAAAKLLAMKPPTVRRLIRTGQLAGEARKLPGRARRQWVVYVTGIRDFLRTTDRSGPL